MTASASPDPRPAPHLRRPDGGARRAARPGFTLMEVLAALLVLAIVLPIAMNGIGYASRSADLAIKKRDAAIREAHRAGLSLRAIAEEGGISHMSIKRIVARSSD